jgi:Tol biopolymer transport system component/DNA-binding winged helix-turn-helix (wHTH) protein
VAEARLERKKIRFGVFDFDTEARQLSKRGMRLKISGQPMEILGVLLERPGEVVTREELRQRLWAGDTFVDFEHSLNAAVNKLREALGDDPARPQFVATVPRQGYRFVGAIENETRAMLAEVPRPEHQAERKTNHRRVWQMIAAVVALAVIAAGAIVAWRSHSDPRLRIKSDSQITTTSGFAMYPSFSPDGSQFAYCKETPQGLQIFVRQPGTGSRDVQITSDDGQNIQPAWSPDGQWIVYHSIQRGGIWRVSALGELSTKLADTGARPAWSPDGQWIAYQSGVVNDLSSEAPGVFAPSTLWVMRADGTDSREITKLGQPEGGHGTPSWSPDGKRVVFVAATGFAELWTIDVSSGALTRLAPLVYAYFDPVFTKDGRSVLYGALTQNSYGLFQIRLSEDGSKPVGEPIQLKTGMVRVKHLALSSDGKKLLYSAAVPESGVWTVSLGNDGRLSEPRILRETTGERTTLPRFSPDGKHVAVGSWRVGGCCEIWMMNSDGSSPELLVVDAGFASWLPDNRTLMFKNYNGRDTIIRALDVRSRESKVVATVSQVIGSMDLSPSGATIAYHTATNGILNIWTMDVATSQRRQLTFEKEFIGFPIWSPDEKKLAANVKTSIGDEAVILDPNTSQITVLTKDRGQHWPSGWSPDGRKIYFAGQHNAVWNVYSLDVGTGVETQLTRYNRPSAFVRYPRASPDGKTILYEHTQTMGNIWMLELE